MKFEIIVLEQVYEEVNESVLYYEQRQTGLGISLLDEWENTLKIIQNNPNLFENKLANFKQAQLDRFPYLIIFEIKEFEVIILRFIHAKRHPRKRFKQ
ncbi:MAG: hypothetical protein ACEQSR_00655 [Candidatus Methylacidiphilales bacterium]